MDFVAPYRFCSGSPIGSDVLGRVHIVVVLWILSPNQNGEDRGGILLNRGMKRVVERE